MIKIKKTRRKRTTTNNVKIQLLTDDNNDRAIATILTLQKQFPDRKMINSDVVKLHCLMMRRSIPLMSVH